MAKQDDKNRLLRQFHSILSKKGISNEGKYEMLASSYGVTSSRDLNVKQLTALCKALTGIDELDEKRKKAIGAVFGFYKTKGLKVSVNYVVGTIEKAAGKSSINKISAKELQRIYYEFKRQTEELERIKTIVRGNLPSKTIDLRKYINTNLHELKPKQNGRKKSSERDSHSTNDGGTVCRI